MRRLLFLIHRYLGIGIGLVMVMWCLSGFVMMYVPYPTVSDKQVMQGNVPLDLGACCDTSRIESLGLVDVNRFTVEMLGDTLVLRFRASGSRNPIINLRNGEQIEGISLARAEDIARSFKARSGIAGEIVDRREVVRDQWTVTPYYDYYRPLYRFTANDPAQTQWYVSSNTGETAQLTTKFQRFWNWLGSVPHWLYPEVLRQHDAVWQQLVIWLSVAGIFLTVIGIYIGIAQYRTLRGGRRSPYRGIALWHHYLGLLFGLFILSWIASGLLAMNPWGLFDLSGGAAERKRLQGVPLYSREVASFLERLPQADLPDATVRIEGYSLLGKFYFLAYEADGSYQRFDGKSLRAQPVAASEWQRYTELLAGQAPVQEAGLLEEEDAYYYGHKSARELPVYRIILDNNDRTRLYLNATSGEIAAHFDREQRTYRWLFSGLHQVDLSRVIRSRPLWDVLMWLLLIGVSLGTVTGTYMGVRRLLR